MMTRDELIKQANQDNAAWPQYAGLFDNYILVRLKRDVRTKMGLAFEKGEVAIAEATAKASPESLYPNVLCSPRVNGRCAAHEVGQRRTFPSLREILRPVPCPQDLGKNNTEVLESQQGRQGFVIISGPCWPPSRRPSPPGGNKAHHRPYGRKRTTGCARHFSH